MTAPVLQSRLVNVGIKGRTVIFHHRLFCIITSFYPDHYYLLLLFFYFSRCTDRKKRRVRKKKGLKIRQSHRGEQKRPDFLTNQRKVQEILTLQ